MPKRKNSKSREDTTDDTNEKNLNLTLSPSEIPIKRGRGRPRSSRMSEGSEKLDEPEQTPESSEGKPIARRKKNSQQDNKEDSGGEVFVEKRNEPEKRNLRATNSRRSREAFVRHMAESAAKAQKDENTEAKTEKQQDAKEEKADDVAEEENKTIENDEKRPESVDDATNSKSEENSSVGLYNYVPLAGLSSPPAKAQKPICIEVRERYLDDTKEENETKPENENQSKPTSSEVQLVNSKKDQTDDNESPKQEGNSDNDNNEAKKENLKDDLNTPSTSGGKTARNRRLSHRSGIEFKIGGRLEACDFMSNWYASKIVDVDWNEKEVLIHFEGWSPRFDEWVSMDSYRLRAITRTSTRKETKQKLKEEFKVNENVLAKWSDGKMYPARVVSVNTNGSCQVTFLDDGIQKTVKPINLTKVSKEDFAFHVNQAKSLERKGRPLKKNLLSSSDDDYSSDNHDAKSKRDDSKDSIRNKRAGRPPKADKSVSPVGARRKKLLIGGIFQAKRTFQDNQPSKKRGPKSREPEPGKPGRKPMRLPGLKAKAGKTKHPKLLDDSKEELTSSKKLDIDDSIEEQRRVSGGAPKEFRIEEDHNHFKCPIENCGKGFRKESLLSSHMKHYHDNTSKTARKREPSGGSSSAKIEEPTPEVYENDQDLSEAESIVELKASTSVKKGRGLKHTVAKHKVNIAKRRPQLLYRKKGNEEEVEESPKVKGNAKKKPVKNPTFTVPVEDGSVKTELNADEGEVVDQSLITSSPVRKTGRRKKWRCNTRSPKKLDSSVVSFPNEAVAEPLKSTPASPEVQIGMHEENGGKEEVVNCVCRVLEEEGLMMQCETCLAWQHGVCFGIETEDKVPEKYICFACKNPSGQRESYRYWYDQDWWKTGQMARFNFSQIDEVKDRKLANSMLKTHTLTGSVLDVKKILHCLDQKLDVVKNADESNLPSWNQLWRSNASGKEVSSASPLSDGSRQPAMHSDHSYSVPRNNNGVENPEESINVEVCENGKTEKIDELVKSGMEKPITNGIEKEENIEGMVEAAGNVEESNVPEDSFNLFLDNIDQMHDEVDHRLDEICQHIEALEAEWDDDNGFTPNSNSMNDVPALKKMLKMLQSNLDKVQRMSTFH